MATYMAGVLKVSNLRREREVRIETSCAGVAVAMGRT